VRTAMRKYFSGFVAQSELQIAQRYITIISQQRLYGLTTLDAELPPAA
jgi:hypothetical protein